MLKRTIYVGNAAYLKLQNRQLKIIDPKTKQERGSIPIEDIAILVLDHFQITISQQVILALQGVNAVILSCDAHHLPLGMMLPLYGHVEHSARLKTQMQISEPLRKQLWKQTVEAKISQQMLLLKKLGKPHAPMKEYLLQVKSDDSTNMEGAAAQYYWGRLFDNFKREREGRTPNNLLNFGYAVLRSIIARAIVSTGLHPTIGIFHRNQYNPFCLADDIMEPYRPYVDELVYQLVQNQSNTLELTKELKAHLLTISTRDVQMMQKMRPLMVAVSSTTASLYKCFAGEIRLIRYPLFR